MTIPVASFTRKAIREAFLQLLEERMLSEITVKDIVERCGINRNSFYYHYRDLPALIEEIVQEEADAVIAEHASLHDIVDCFDAVVSFVTHRKRAILHIFRSVSRDVFERYLMKTCRYFVDTYLTAALMGEPVDPKDREAAVHFYACTCFGLIIDWLSQGMPEQTVHTCRRVFAFKAGQAEDLARQLHQQHT